MRSFEKKEYRPHENKQKNPYRHAQKKIRSSYVIPYSLKNKIILVGQKQIVSYTALGKIKNKIDSGDWHTLKTHIEEKKPFIDEHGAVIGSDKRFCGVLLPGGGKPCFFGGKVEESDPKISALRELKEETGIDLENIDCINDFLEEIYDTSWGGVYYALNIDRIEIKDFFMDSVLSFKIEVEGLEGNLNLSEIYDGAKLRFNPEMHKIEFIAVENDKALFIDEDYIQDGAKTFCKFISNKLKIFDAEQIEYFCNQVISHILNFEPIDDNEKSFQIVSEKIINYHNNPEKTKEAFLSKQIAHGFFDQKPPSVKNSLPSGSRPEKK